MRFCLTLASGCAALLPGIAAAQDLPVPADASGWFVRTYAIVGFSHAEGSFSTDPAGLTDSEHISYDPQENFGVGAGIGYRTAIGGIPVRAVLDGSFNFRHDTDVRADFGGASQTYAADLQIAEARLSLLADVYQFGWGTLYAGGGLGVARLETEVGINSTLVDTDESDIVLSPSVEIGLVLDGIFGKVIPEISYRFRWFGDTESGTFPGGETLEYQNVHIHDIKLGFTVPLDGGASDPSRVLTDSTRAAYNWTGFYAGATGGYAFANDITATPLETEAGAPYDSAGGYDLDADGFTGAVQVGVDRQWKWFVAGLGGEVGGILLDGSGVNGSSPGGDTGTEISSDWYAAATARVGLAFDRLLIYARGGAVFLNGEARTVDDCAAPPCSLTTVDAFDDDVLFGWTAGGGVEYAFGERWTAGLEYRIFDIAFDEPEPVGTSSAGDTVFHTVDFGAIQTVRGSVSYRW